MLYQLLVGDARWVEGSFNRKVGDVSDARTMLYSPKSFTGSALEKGSKEVKFCGMEVPRPDVGDG